MELRQRRTVARLIRFGLIGLAVVLAAMWGIRRLPGKGRIGVETEVPTVETLAAGDVQIFNRDSTVDVILTGRQLLAGLSPKTVAKVRADLEKSAAGETSGVGGSIAKMVKKTVAEKIGMHVAYDLDDIQDLRYDDGRLVIEWKRGGEQRVLGDVKVNGDREADRFSEAEAQRLIAAFRARR